MSIRMSTEGMPIPPTRRATLPRPSDVTTQQGRYLADVETKHFPVVQTSHPLPKTTDDVKFKRVRRRLHPGVKPFVIGAVLMTGIYFLGNLVIGPIWTHLSRQWHYGDSRVSLLEARVGHQDETRPTLFLATPYRGRVQVIVWPAGDPKQVQVYTLTQVERAEDAAVTLKTEDVNGDGYIDLIVTVQTRSSTPYVLFNTGKSFQFDKPAPAQEKPQQQKDGSNEQQ